MQAFLHRHGLILTAVTGAVISLAACGGGGGSTSSTSTANTSASYSGTVTGLGSIVVNGVRFSTVGATTTDPDDPSSSYGSALTLGSSVTLQGNIDPATGTVGQATRIVVHGGVRGIVGAVSGNTFVVAGQLVQVDANTLYADGASWASVNGMSVEVHGTLSANNVLLATRVEQESQSGTYPYAVVGQVSALDTDAGTFQLALSTKTLTLPIPAGMTLSNGLTVRVLSTIDPTGVTPLTTNNTKVIVKGDRSLSGKTKLRGAITSLSPLTINDITVDASQNPKWDDGLNFGALTVGQVVKVEGTLSNGTLVAREIEADEYEHKSGTGEYLDRIKLYGLVSATNGTTFVVQGVSVSLSSGALPAVGSYVEVKARLVNGVLTAHEVSGNTTTSSSRFETYGTVACNNGLSDLQVSSFNLLTTTQGTLAVNGSNASKVVYDDDVRTTSVGSYSCFLEVEGSVSNGVIQATKIEVKRRTAPV
ncbi:DUF5666 domain-containing protein [Aquabacterium sp.]|uniref:DUF5666 domain-containing protein n=1 Tax=Aquabacterium sp. TaxID=1872578 RepID=UPI0027BABA66|nr:DUF5666 domain-containing protein [Aquabacterium sp.]